MATEGVGTFCLVRFAARHHCVLRLRPSKSYTGVSHGRGARHLEDALTHLPIGINGIAKTLVGYIAASVGVLINVENHSIRLILTFLLSLLGGATYIFVYRFLLGVAVETNWLTELYKALGNSLIALVLFPLLDRTKIRD